MAAKKPKKAKSDKQKPNRRKAPKTAFKPGVSGNPKGRPPKARCIPDILQKIGEEESTEDGRYNNLEVIMRKVFEYAVGGRPWAVQFIAERTEGKAVQPVDVAVSGGLNVSAIENMTEEEIDAELERIDEEDAPSGKETESIEE